MIDVEPLGDGVMVKVSNPRAEREGLVLPKEIQPDLEEGMAVAYGPDVPQETRDAIESCGDGVIFAAGDYEARTWNVDGSVYRFVPASDIMGALFPGEGDRVPRIQEALGKWSLMEWEEAKGTLLGGLLVRPVERAKAHFTGLAIMHGPKADEIENGKRYFFEQFSDFKSWHEGKTRYAFIPYGAIQCEIPERTADVCLAPSEVASPEVEAALR